MNFSSTAELFFSKLDELPATNLDDKAEGQVGFIFDAIDDMLCEDQFGLVQEILDKMELNKYEKLTIVGMLSATFPAEDKLANRMVFIERVRTHFIKTYGNGDIVDGFIGWDQ